MTCREAASLLALFFDGELDARQMRAVAMHGTRCEPCEAELRRLERVQQLVSESIDARLDEVDFASLWTKIEPRLTTVERSPWRDVRALWRERESQWWAGVPALVAAAAVAILAFVLFMSQQPTTQPAPTVPQVASADDPVSIDSLDADADSVAVVNDPETKTTILWVSEDTILSSEEAR